MVHAIVSTRSFHSEMLFLRHEGSTARNAGLIEVRGDHRGRGNKRRMRHSAQVFIRYGLSGPVAKTW